MTPFIEAVLIMFGATVMLAAAAPWRIQIRCRSHPQEDRLSRHVR